MIIFFLYFTLAKSREFLLCSVTARAQTCCCVTGQQGALCGSQGCLTSSSKSLICINDRDNQSNVLKLHCGFSPLLIDGCSLVLQTITRNCTHIFAVGVLVLEVEAFVNTFVVFPNFLLSYFAVLSCLTIPNNICNTNAAFVLSKSVSSFDSVASFQS